MTRSEIKSLLAAADPDIRHYFTMSGAEAYSYWEETRRLPFLADDAHNASDQAWRFYVHRYTKTEDDAIAQTIFNTLDSDPRTTVVWTVSPIDPETGYIHHIFECEGY